MALSAGCVSDEGTTGNGNCPAATQPIMAIIDKSDGSRFIIRIKQTRDHRCHTPAGRAFKLLFKQSSLAGAAENVYNFVLVKFLHVVAGGAEIFAGIEFCGLLCKYTTDGGCHGKTAV